MIPSFRRITKPIALLVSISLFGNPAFCQPNGAEDEYEDSQAAAPMQTVSAPNGPNVIFTPEHDQVVGDGMNLIEFYNGQTNIIRMNTDGQALLLNGTYPEMVRGKKVSELVLKMQRAIGSVQYKLLLQPSQQLVAVMGAVRRPGFAKEGRLSECLAQVGDVSPESNYRLIVHFPSQNKYEVFNRFDIGKGKNDRFIPGGSTIDAAFSSSSLVNRNQWWPNLTNLATIGMLVLNFIVVSRGRK
jgi:hypothetical protein